MAGPKPTPVSVNNLALGLITRDPSTSLPPGALRKADNVAITDGELRSAPGFERVTNSLFRDHAYVLDGQTQYFHGKVDNAATTTQLQASANDPFTIEFVFRLDGMPVDIVGDASFPTAMSMCLFKGPGTDLFTSPGTNASADINWYVTIFNEGDTANAGKLLMRWFFGWDSTPEQIEHTQEIEIGKWYHAAATCDGDQVSTYLHEVGTALGSAVNGGSGHSSDTMIRNTEDFFIGANPVELNGTATVISTSVQVSVDADTQTYTLNAGTWDKTPTVGSQALVAGMANAANNGVKRVIEATTTTFKVEADAADLTDEAHTASTTITEFHGEPRRVQYGFRGVIQEVRIWDDERSTSELAAYDDVQFTDAEASSESNLVYYQRLTGAGDDTYYFTSTKGTAGGGSGNSPRVSLLPRDATWRGTGHVLGNPSSGDYTLDLDGITQGVVIQNADRYRKSTVNDKGELEFPDYWGFSARVTPRSLTDRTTVFHYCPTLSDEWTIHRLNEATRSSTFTGLSADSNGNILLEIVDVGSSVFQFRAVVYHKSGGGTVYATSEESSISGGLVAGTEYTVSIGVDTVSRKITVYVDDNSNTSSDWQQSVISSTSITAAAAGDTYTVGSSWTTTPSAGDRVFWSGFTNEENNGWKTVESATSTVITVKESLVNETVSATAVLETTVESTPKGDHQGTQKYAASIGRCLLRSRQLITAPGDPNGIEVEYDYSRSFDGEIRQVLLAVPQQAWSIESLHNLSYSQEVTLGSVAKVGIGIVSAWLFTEGSGGAVEDVATGNILEMEEDSNHVWGYSGVATNEASEVKCLFDHRYTTRSGEQKVFVAIAGGTAYSVNPSTGSTSFFADGFRNDDGNLISTMKYQDSQILCAGRGARGNFHLWRDQLWPLAIEAPTGTIPFGLTDQMNREASLQPGTYEVAFTFYSAYTGKESPVGPVIQFEIKKKRANLALGDVAEINQTYPTSGLSLKKEPFNIEAATNKKTGLRAAAWIGVGSDDELVTADPDWWQSDPQYSGSDDITSDRVAKLKKVIWDTDVSGSHTKNALIDDREEMTDEEFVATVEQSIGRVFAEADPLGFVEIKGRFVGRDAFLRVQDMGTASDPDMISYTGTPGEIGFPGVASGDSPRTALYRGTGDVGHGLVLPVSNDPQVTHLRMYRTLANSSTFRLAEQVPNGTKGFVHYTPDTSLVGQILDITSGQPPAVEYVADFGSRAVYIKDPDNPDFVYFSQPNEPWNVPAENVIKMADGDSVELTGVGRTEGALMLFKDDTTFVIRPPNGLGLPFSIETRQRDVGCVAPFSVTNIEDRIYFCGEKGMYRYDTAFLQPISRPIEPTWESEVSVEHRDKIVGIHDRRNDSWIISYPSGDTTVGGSVVNDRMLVLDYSVYRNTGLGWTQRSNLSASTFAIIPDGNEVDRIYFADPLGYIYQWDSGSNYGVGSLTDRTLTASAGASTSVTVPQATLGSVPDGHKGFWITLVRAADSSRESRYVTADTLASPSVLTVAAWTGTAPVSGDTILVGSIESDAIFGELSPFGNQMVSHLIASFLRATKQDTSSSLVEWQWQGLGGINNSHNEQEPSFSTVLNGEKKAFSNQKVDMALATEARGRRLAFRVLSQGPDQPFALRDFTILVLPSGVGEYVPLT